MQHAASSSSLHSCSRATNPPRLLPPCLTPQAAAPRSLFASWTLAIRHKKRSPRERLAARQLGSCGRKLLERAGQGALRARATAHLRECSTTLWCLWPVPCLALSSRAPPPPAALRPAGATNCSAAPTVADWATRVELARHRSSWEPTGMTDLATRSSLPTAARS